MGAGISVDDESSITTLGVYYGTKPAATLTDSVASVASSMVPSELRSVVETTKIIHTGGETCAPVMRVGGIPRSVAMDVVCGPQNRIVSVVENGMCMYEVVFESPFACSTTQADKLRKVCAKFNIFFLSLAFFVFHHSI